MKELLPMLVIISAHKADQSMEQNWIAHGDLRTVLSGFPFREVRGYYRGASGQSVAVTVPRHLQDISLWANIARHFRQECFLIRYPDGSCYICSCADGTEKYLGQWQELSREAAAGQDHTEVGGRYYAAI